jgi:ABC-type multidrug transport system fused ATPase/permease subunit
MKNDSYMSIFLSKIKDKWYRVILSILSGIVRSILMLLPTYFIRNIINALSTEFDIYYIAKAAALTIILPIIVLFLYVIDTRISKYVFDIIKDIRITTVNNILSKKLRWILSQNRNDLFNRVISSTTQIADFYFSTLSDAVWYSTTIVIGTLLMLSINVPISIALLALSLLQLLCTTMRKKATKQITQRDNEIEIEGLSNFNNIIEYNSFIKVALLQDKEIENNSLWMHKSWKIYKASTINLLISDSITFVIMTAQALVLYIMAQQMIINNQILIGDIVALNSYIAWLTPVFFGFQRWQVSAFSSQVNKQRVEIFLEKSSIVNTGMICPNKRAVKMEAKNISFSYSSTDILSEVTFKLQLGDVMYIVGASGSGKSTLTNILTNLESDYSGDILYNDINIKQISDVWLRNNVVCANQESDIINTTLLDNLLFSGRTTDRNEILSILDDLQLSSLIYSLPGGLDWDMQKNPRALSDGEKKRITIARALLADPRVLILDEPTAGLDAVTKQLIIDKIKARTKSKILIIVTHDKIFENESNILYMN